MDYSSIIYNLKRNSEVFKAILKGLPKEEYLWKPSPEKWCILEILCHLHDEEKEDFRARTKGTLDDPTKEFIPIDPPTWVEEREYIKQNYEEMLDKFLIERKKSIEWLMSLKNPNWNNTYQHPILGEMTASLFLSNWLAHDYLHIRQIIKTRFDHFRLTSSENLDYAGNW